MKSIDWSGGCYKINRTIPLFREASGGNRDNYKRSGTLRSGFKFFIQAIVNCGSFVEVKGIRGRKVAILKKDALRAKKVRLDNSK